MHRLNDYYEETIAAHFLPALINDDYTGLSDPEAAELDAFLMTFCALPDLTISTADDEPSFAVDAVTRLHANCYTIRFYFTNYALTPQQHALDLN
jgi:hypothetical protein